MTGLAGNHVIYRLHESLLNSVFPFIDALSCAARALHVQYSVMTYIPMFDFIEVGIQAGKRRVLLKSEKFEKIYQIRI